MKYFCDIECNQYTDDIISIAVENEAYESYSTLIKPSNKITPFITKLTGITNEEVLKAPHVGLALTKLINWLGGFNDDDQFYFYGNEDEIVLKKTLRKITNQNGISLISHVLGHIVDYSLEVKDHFRVAKSIALIKIVEYYQQKKVYQAHNALDDARYLHYIYNQISLEEEPIEDAFPEYKTESAATNYILRCDDDGNVIEKYASMADALSWIVAESHKAGRVLTDRQAVRGKLGHSIKFNSKYYGFYWSKEGKHLETLDKQ